jgi:hypothetical protein
MAQVTWTSRACVISRRVTGRTGKYLITPPGYKEQVPDGYIVLVTDKCLSWLRLGLLYDLCGASPVFRFRTFSSPAAVPSNLAILSRSSSSQS